MEGRLPDKDVMQDERPPVIPYRTGSLLLSKQGMFPYVKTKSIFGPDAEGPSAHPRLPPLE